MADAVSSPNRAMQMAGVLLQQTLHGYSDGHRLLQSSAKISDDVARLMLRMSDLSGRNVINGFQEYVTGYPLPSINAYAFAKTWYASEIPRPGCVWTHTLILPTAAVDSIPSLVGVEGLFRRPNLGKGQEFYSQAIPVPESEIGIRTWLPDLEGKVEPLLAALYGSNRRPIIIGAHNSAEYEALVLYVWSQQWPSLRRTFTFSTGSLSARKFAGKPLDVQCVPLPLVREVLLEMSSDGNEPIVLNTYKSETAEWMKSAVHDLSHSNDSRLRIFLWEVADNGTEREDFGRLTRVYEAIEKEISASDLVDVVAGLFPMESDAVRLKRCLFGEPSTRTSIISCDEVSILTALGSTQFPSAFNEKALSLYERGGALALGSLDSCQVLLGRLFRSTLNPLGEEILAGLISTLTPEAALQVADKQPQFLTSLLSARPELATSPELWRAAAGRRWELITSLSRHEKLNDALAGKITQALLESGSDSLIHRALEIWSKAAVFGALDWIAIHDGRMSETCREALSGHIQSVMDWAEGDEQRPEKSLLAIAHIVGPNVHKIAERDSRLWLQMLQRLQTRLSEREMAYLYAFLVALALKNSPPNHLMLLSNCFEPLHRIAWQDALPDDAWGILDPIVPSVWWPNDWDKCERLRRGIVQGFVRHGWPPTELSQCVTNAELLRRVIKSADKVDGGRRLVHSIENY